MTQQQQRPAQAMRGNPKYTWDDLVAAIGQDFSAGEVITADEVIDRTAVERYCEPWEIGNPIHWDRRVAKGAGYRDVVAPWSSIRQTFSYSGFWRPGKQTAFPTDLNKDASGKLGTFQVQGKELPFPPHRQGIVTDMEMEFFEPACVGDRITVKGKKLVNARVRQTRVGYGAFTNTVAEYFNQRGELVARANFGSFSYNPGEQGPQR